MSSSLRLRGGEVEVVRHAADGVPIGAFDELYARLAQELLHALGNRRCACDAGGLDSCGVEQTGRGLGGFDEEVVRFLKYGAAPCEGADDAAGIQVWYELARAGEQGLHIAGVRVLVALLSHFGGGGDDRVVVHGSRDDDALGNRGRHRVERHDGAGLLVEHGDVALAPYHAQPVISGHA